MTWGPMYMYYHCPKCGLKFEYAVDMIPDSVRNSDIVRNVMSWVCTRKTVRVSLMMQII